MGREIARVVEISVESTSKFGSGYLLTDSHVLTAHHVVAQSEQSEAVVPSCKARLLGQRNWFNASIAWSNRDLDVALLEATGSIPNVSLLSSPPKLGRVHSAEDYPCEAIG